MLILMAHVCFINRTLLLTAYGSMGWGLVAQGGSMELLVSIVIYLPVAAP